MSNINQSIKVNSMSEKQDLIPDRCIDRKTLYDNLKEETMEKMKI